MVDFGRINISRKAYATDRFWNEPREFSRWEAWEWMIQEAAWKPYPKVFGGNVVQLARGEFIGSIQSLAKVWRWTPKKVRGFVTLTIELERIRAQRETHFGIVYLLVNYEKYQSRDIEKGTTKGKVGAQQRARRGAQESPALAPQIGNEGHSLGHSEGHILKEVVKRIPSDKSSGIAKAPRIVPSRRCPRDFEPDAEHVELADSLGVDLGFEVAKLKDHEFARPHSDWAATLRNWIRRAIQTQATNSHQSNEKPIIRESI